MIRGGHRLNALTLKQTVNNIEKIADLLIKHVGLWFVCVEVTLLLLPSSWRWFQGCINSELAIEGDRWCSSTSAPPPPGKSFTFPAGSHGADGSTTRPPSPDMVSRTSPLVCTSLLNASLHCPFAMADSLLWCFFNLYLLSHGLSYMYESVDCIMITLRDPCNLNGYVFCS